MYACSIAVLYLARLIYTSFCGRNSFFIKEISVHQCFWRCINTILICFVDDNNIYIYISQYIINNRSIVRCLTTFSCILLWIQIISSGNLSSADHRVVTDSKVSRTSIGCFINTSSTCRIEPAKALIKDSSPLYRAFIYKDFASTYIQGTLDGVAPLDLYKLQP